MKDPRVQIRMAVRRLVKGISKSPTRTLDPIWARVNAHLGVAAFVGE